MSIRVAYDITCLAEQVGLAVRRTGIFRVTEEVMHELIKQPDVEVNLIGACGSDSAFIALSCLAYIREYTELLAFKSDNPLRSRLGLRSLHQYMHHQYLAARSQKKMPSKIFRITYKLLRKYDAYLRIGQDVDLLHSQFHQLPGREVTGSVPRVLTVHDLIPIVAPEFVSPIGTQILQSILDSIDLQRDWVICDSEYTRQDLLTYTGISLDRTFVIPLAAAEYFQPVTDTSQISSICNQYQIPPGKYFLSVASGLDQRTSFDSLLLTPCF
jgi:hypothetical protein